MGLVREDTKGFEDYTLGLRASSGDILLPKSGHTSRIIPFYKAFRIQNKERDDSSVTVTRATLLLFLKSILFNQCGPITFFLITWVQFLSLLPALEATSTAIRSYRTVYGVVPREYSNSYSLWNRFCIVFYLKFKIIFKFSSRFLLSFIYYLFCFFIYFIFLAKFNHFSGNWNFIKLWQDFTFLPLDIHLHYVMFSTPQKTMLDFN